MEHEGKQAAAGRELVTTPRVAAAVLVLVILAVALLNQGGGELGGGSAEAVAAPGNPLATTSAVAEEQALGPAAAATAEAPAPAVQAPIRVQVVDPGGRPLARVPVRLWLPAPTAPELSLAEVVRSTGADGIAEFESFRTVMAKHSMARRLRVEQAELEPGTGGLGFSVRGVPDRVLVLVRSEERAPEAVIEAEPKDPGPVPAPTASAELTDVTSVTEVAEGTEDAEALVEGTGLAAGGPASVPADDEPPAQGPASDGTNGIGRVATDAATGTTQDAGTDADTSLAANQPGTSPTLQPGRDPQPEQPTPGYVGRGVRDERPPFLRDAPPSLAPTPAVPLEPGAVVGRLLLDPGVPASVLRVELDEVLPTAGPSLGRRLGPIAPAADGSFRFDGVAPGLASLRVSLVGTRRTLLWVDELEVAPGEVLRDARLWPGAGDARPASTPGSKEPTGGIDLTGQLFPIEVELFDEYGRRLDPAVVLPLDRTSGARGLLEVQTLGTTPRLWGDSRVLAGEAELDLLLVAPDRQVREVVLSGTLLSGGRGGERGLGADGRDQALAFELLPARARQIELRLVGWPGGPGVVLEPRYAAGQRLEARLERRDGQRFPWDHARHRGLMDERGRLRLEPADPGEFVVRLAWIDEDGAGIDLDLAVPISVGPEAEVGEPGSSDRDIVFLPIGRSGFAD